MDQKVTGNNVDGFKLDEEQFLTPLPRKQGESITMNFPDAMAAVIAGKSVRRVPWESQTDHCLLKDGWLSIFTKGDFHTWSINDGDMEGNDWYILREDK